MGNIKRLLALCLSVVLILCSNGVMATESASSDKFFTEIMEEKVLSSFEFNALKAMNMLWDDIEWLNADAMVTRAQFVAGLYRIAGYEKHQVKIDEIPFIDVSIDNPYKDEICAFYKMNIINGTGEGTFMPDLPITYEHAVKLVLDVCGYKDYVLAKYGNSEKSHVYMAQFLKINKGMTIPSVSGPLSVDNAVQLLYNAARTRIMDTIGVSKAGDVFYDSSNSEELISWQNKIYYSEGILKSNGIVSLINQDVQSNMVIIGNDSYAVSGFDATELLGHNVKYFYKEENGNRTLLWAESIGNDNVIEIDSYDLCVDDENYTIKNIVYEYNGKRKNADISYADIVYNYALYNGASLSYLKPIAGTMKLVDWNDDSIYDVVIVNDYRSVLISSNVPALSYISDKFGTAIDFSDYDTVEIYKDGIVSKQEELAIGTLVTVLSDEINKKYIKVHSNNSVIVGELEEIAENGLDSVYCISGSDYKLARSFVQRNENYIKINPVLGRNYKFYLDVDGRIAEIEETTDQPLRYALLVDAMENDEFRAPKDSALIKLVLDNGEVTWASTRKSITLDGIKKCTGMDLLSHSSLHDSDGNVIEQIVKVAFDSKGELKEIWFAKDCTNLEEYPYGYNSSEFSLDYEATRTTTSISGLRMFGKYMMDASVMLFVKYNTSELEEPYGVVKGNSIGVGSYRLKLYDIRADQSVTVAYRDSAGYGGSLAGKFLVDSVKTRYVDGENLDCICGFYGGTYMEYTEKYEGVIPDDIRQGDLVKLSVVNNMLTKVSRFINLFEDEPIGSGAYLSYIFDAFSYVYTASNKSITLVSPKEYEADWGKVITIPISVSRALPVTVVDVASEEIYKGDVTDIFLSTTPNVDGSPDINSNTMMAYVEVYDNQVTQIILVKR